MNVEEPEAGSGIGWLRVVVWLMPTALLVALVPVSGFLALPFAGEAAAAAFLALLGCLAYFDARLHCQQMRIPPGDQQSKLVYRSFAFMAGQMILAPVAVVIVEIVERA